MSVKTTWYILLTFFRAKAKDPTKRIGDYEETQEDYEKRLEKQKLRQRNLREAETTEEHKVRKTKDAKAKAMRRLNENDDEWNNRLDVQRDCQQKLRESLQGAEKRHFQNKDALRKQIERSNESKEETELRRLIDASRNFEVITEETEDQHQSRIAKQKERQQNLRSKETLLEKKTRLELDAKRKVLKRSAGYSYWLGNEHTDNPGKDWHASLDADLDRKRKLRADESIKNRNIRREKDNQYHKEKRGAETYTEKRERQIKDNEYQYRKNRPVRGTFTHLLDKPPLTNPTLWEIRQAHIEQTRPNPKVEIDKGYKKLDVGQATSSKSQNHDQNATTESTQDVEKTYTYQRSKINFTMKDLENDLEEDDDFEINGVPNTFSLRSQPKRGFTIEKNWAPDHNDTSDEENSNDQEEGDGTDSNSNWYNYPESSNYDDSSSDEITNIRHRESSPEIDFDINYD